MGFKSILDLCEALLPECILAVGALLSLIICVPFKVSSLRIACYFTSGTVFIALLLLCVEYGGISDASYDQFSVSLKIIVLSAVLAVTLMIISISTMTSNGFGEHHSDNMLPFELPILLVLCSIGMCLLISANDLLTMYLSLELMSLPSYIIAACNRSDAKAQEAGLKYFILGALASGLFLFGTSIIYGFTASVHFDSLGQYYIDVFNEEDIVGSTIPIGFLVGVMLLIIAICFKVSAAPFHMWVPDVYQGSMTLVTAFFAAVVKVASIGILLKVLYRPFYDLAEQLQQIMIFLAVTSMLVGSFGAIMQKELKRMLAYGSIAHVGFMFMGISTIEILGVRSTIFYLIMYAIMTLAIFAVIIALHRGNQLELKRLAGLSQTNPLVAVSIAILMLSMAGIPPFAGFFAKFFVLYSVVQQGLYLLAIIGVITTVIGAYYYIRVIKVVYFDGAVDAVAIYQPFILKLIMIIGVLVNFLYILVPVGILRFAHVAAEGLFK